MTKLDAAHCILDEIIRLRARSNRSVEVGKVDMTNTKRRKA